MSVNSNKVHRIVEHIKRSGCRFEPLDVCDDLDEVLYDYGVFDGLTSDERLQLTQEMQRLAEQCQEAEIALQAGLAGEFWLGGREWLRYRE